MSLRSGFSLLVVLLAIVMAVFAPLGGINTVLAGSGSIPVFSVDNQLNVNIQVSCPGSVGFTWQVAVNNWGNVVYEEGSAGKNFRMDGSRISNGHHNALARVRCNGEPNDWSNATTSTVGFDWFGGNPTPVPPPPGYEVAVSITVAPTTVPPGTPVKITVQAACSNTTVRAVRVKADGVIFNEHGGPVLTTEWATNNVGDHTVTAEAACNGDDSWKTSPGASVNISVRQNVQPSGGSSSGGTAGNPVAPPSGNTGNNDPKPPTIYGATIPEARDNQGGASLEVYCQRNKRGKSVEPDNGDPNKWKCADGQPIDMNAVCLAAYGDGFTAYLDPNVQPQKYAWRCKQGGSNPQPQAGNATGNNQPAQPTCALPNKLKAGMRGRVTITNGDPTHLRSSISGNTIFAMPEGYEFNVAGDAVCGNKGNWWIPIRLDDGRTGWAAEGHPSSGYWLEPAPAGNQSPTQAPQQPTQRPQPTATQAPVQNQSSVPVDKMVEAQGLEFPPGNGGKYIQAPGDRTVFFYPDSQGCNGASKAKLYKGDYFDILFDEVDGSGNHCYRLNSNLGPGWIKGEGIAVLKSENTFSDQISCQDGTGNTSRTGDGILFVGFRKRGFLWCTEYVIKQYPKLQDCWKGYPNAHLWDDWARTRNNCGLVVNPPTAQKDGGILSYEEIRPGDIVVWEAGCGPATDYRGHVGIVSGVQMNPSNQPQKRDRVEGPVKANIVVDEANGSGDGQTQTGVLHGVYGECMSFIRVPWSR